MSVLKSIIIVMLLTNSMLYAKLSLPRLMEKIGTKSISKTTKVIRNSKYTKNLVKPKLAKAIRPAMSSVLGVASKISKKGYFEDAFISNSKKPLTVIQQYARYGDAYLNTAKHFSKKAINISAIQMKGLKTKFPTMPNINIKSADIFNNKFVKALQYTGKKGWIVSKKLFELSVEHPKKSIFAGLIAWYAVDPEGFMEQKEEAISWATSTVRTGVSDATKLTLNSTQGIADGFMDTVKEKLTVSNSIVLFLIFISFIIWKVRSYVQRWFKIKAEAFLEKEKSKGKAKHENSDYEEDEGGLL